MKRMFFAMFFLASPAFAQWTEGGARIGANLDTLVVTLPSFGTVMALDQYGSGGRLSVRDTSGFPYVAIWSSYASDGGRLYIRGTNSIVFRAYSTSLDPVEIPQNAIDASEIEDESGVASNSEGLTAVPLTGGGVRDTLLAQSIQVPSAGYLLVLGTAQPTINHTNGAPSGANFGIMVDGAVGSNQDVALSLTENAASGFYTIPVTVQTLVPVASGTHDLVFFGSRYTTSGSFTVYDMQLSVIFLPTAYGTVAKIATTDVPDSQAPIRTSAPSIQQIRAESEAANQARIEKERTEKARRAQQALMEESSAKRQP